MKIAVIGGGPGGYVAAIKAAMLGGDVTVIEKKKVEIGRASCRERV